ncbi:hypothetical protein CASFOL_008560 [Castilleja foliolosa]|uniref:Uncharacterized protein n=1 Tax=Castilleja foliolosa TaxID=1961234 RepID=A0ABD3DZU9_9LAMI
MAKFLLVVLFVAVLVRASQEKRVPPPPSSEDCLKTCMRNNECNIDVDCTVCFDTPDPRIYQGWHQHCIGMCKQCISNLEDCRRECCIIWPQNIYEAGNTKEGVAPKISPN